MRQTNLVVNDKIKTEFKIKEKEGILREISPTVSGSNPGGPTTYYSYFCHKLSSFARFKVFSQTLETFKPNSWGFFD